MMELVRWGSHGDEGVIVGLLGCNAVWTYG
jgi:hypothetical protein